MQGRGQYVSDLVLPRMAHVAFLRSPHAHARIKAIDTRRKRGARRASSPWSPAPISPR
jgi:carbon-monoxide dehydrogenase large subunit